MLKLLSMFTMKTRNRGGWDEIQIGNILLNHSESEAPEAMRMQSILRDKMNVCW